MYVLRFLIATTDFTPSNNVASTAYQNHGGHCPSVSTAANDFPSHVSCSRIKSPTVPGQEVEIAYAVALVTSRQYL